MSDDRPKKSWREIDAGRDRSGGSAGKKRESQDDRAKAKVTQSAAYGKYKAQLDKLFTPGGQALPETLREKLGPQSPNVKLKEELIAKADAASLSAWLAAGQPIPEDARLMMRLLDINDQALLIPVLEALLALLDAGKSKPNRTLLIQKLDGLILKLASGPVVDLARQVRAALD